MSVASVVEDLDRPLVHGSQMIALQPRRPILLVEAQPFAGETFENGVHQDAALVRLDRHDRGRVGLFADVQHVLTEVAEPAAGLTFDAP